MRILHLEDNPDDALLVQIALAREGISAEITRIDSAANFRNAVAAGEYDAVVVDNGVPGFNAKAALEFSLQQHADLPVIVCSGAARPEDVSARLKEGATEYVVKDHLWQLAATLRRIDDRNQRRTAAAEGERQMLAMRRLVDAAQELASARDLGSVMKIICHAAREITHADGATLVLREGSQCFYADENAIGPLWKGRRFSLNACASGWAMRHHQSIAIENVYTDSRVSAEIYQDTFVKSLAVAPLRASNPVGAIGNYWATPHAPTVDEVSLLEALAGLALATMDRVRSHAELQRKGDRRREEMQAAQRELEELYQVVSHDLRRPLRGIEFQLQALKNEGEELSQQAHHSVILAQQHASGMSELIEHLLWLAHLGKVALHPEHLNVSQMVTAAIARLRAQSPDRKVQARVEQGLYVTGDRSLLETAIEHLISNAWKYTQIRPMTALEFGAISTDSRQPMFYLRDNGVGFDMQYADRLFQPFQRMHSAQEYPGAGIGLAAVRRIIERHGGQIWPESGVNEGATFKFTLPSSTSA